MCVNLLSVDQKYWGMNHDVGGWNGTAVLLNVHLTRHLPAKVNGAKNARRDHWGGKKPSYPMEAINFGLLMSVSGPSSGNVCLCFFLMLAVGRVGWCLG